MANFLDIGPLQSSTPGRDIGPLQSPATAQTISPSGIAPTVAFGTAKLNRNIKPAGIAPTVAFGTAQVGLHVNPVGIAPTVTFGTPVIAGPIIVQGIAPTVAFGSPSLAQRLGIHPAGIGQTVAFGTPVIAGPIIAQGIAPTVAFGLLNITAKQTISPTGIGPTIAFGTVKVANVQKISPSGIAPTVAFGTAKVAGSNRAVRPTGIAPTVAFGHPSLTGGAAGWRAWLGTKDCTSFMKIGTSNLSSQAVARWKLTFSMYSASGTFSPVIGQQFMLTEGNNKIFAGVIVEVAYQRAPRSQNQIVYNCIAQDYTALCDRRVIKTTTWAAGTDMAQVFRDIVQIWMLGEGITTNNIPETLGPLDSDFKANYDSCTTKLNELASLAGVVWWVDVNADMHASGLSTLPAAPFALEEGTGYRNLTIKYSLLAGDGYRNIQYAISNLTTTPATPTQDFGVTLPQPGIPAGFLFGVIILPFPAAQITRLTVNGVQQPVYNPITTDYNLEKAWWTFPGSIYITPPNVANNVPALPDPPVTSPFPSPGDVVVVTYIPIGANNVTAIEGEALDPSTLVPAGVTPFGALNTIGSGKWEAVALGQDADTTQELAALSSSELARCGGVPCIADFETDRPGLAVGQALPVNLPFSFAPSKTMLVTQVSGQEMATADLGFGSSWRWKVEAKTDLDAFGTWVNFYEKLIRRGKLPKPLPVFHSLAFAIAPGSSLAGGTPVTSPDIVPDPPGVVVNFQLIAAQPPADQDVTFTIFVNDQAVGTITMPAGSPANVTIQVDIDPTMNPIYLFVNDVVTIAAAYSVIGPNPTPLGNGTLRVNYQV
jgi:hypothetical protein